MCALFLFLRKSFPEFFCALQIAAMHAFIDMESYGGLSIDAALRELLKGFRLPGLSTGSLKKNTNTDIGGSSGSYDGELADRCLQYATSHLEAWCWSPAHLQVDSCQRCSWLRSLSGAANGCQALLS